MNHRSLLGIPWTALAIFVVLALVFVCFPTIDLWFAGFFSDPGTLFHQNNPWPIRVIYYSVEVLSIVTVAALIILLSTVLIRRRPFWGLTAKGLAFLLLALALGPGLVVNEISKNVWGRARPVHIEQFGGKARFTPAFVFSDECQGNCAFVSGHASFGFYFVAFALYFRRHRHLWFALAIGYGGLIGFGRMYQGGHFLSDVIFSFYFVYFPVRMLYYAMFQRGGRSSPGLRATRPRA
ncbi:MAG: phosphatase PAP2 family protein [Desulfatitalea sp.]|nr:phosphatase PAP2 family protein [Desulfatitalea sp.]NNK00891.1 phosphatase PAP2 family protein [Desulfatitalea sp.]